MGASIQRDFDDGGTTWLKNQLAHQRKLYQGLGSPAPETAAHSAIFQGIVMEPFLCVWGYVEKGVTEITTYHSLFKFSNPAEDIDGLREHGGVCGYCVDINE